MPETVASPVCGLLILLATRVRCSIIPTLQMGTLRLCSCGCHDLALSQGPEAAVERPRLYLPWPTHLHCETWLQAALQPEGGPLSRGLCV